MNTILISVLIFAFYNINWALAEEELMTALVITNTGASAPLCGFIYPSYQVDMSKWPNGLNNMTDVGISEDHVKGQMLKRRYTTLFGARDFQARLYTSGDYKSKLSTLVTYKGFSGENISDSMEEVKRAFISESDPNIKIKPNLRLDSFHSCPAIIEALVRSCRQSPNYNQSIDDKTELLNTMKNHTGYDESWNSFYSASIWYTLMADSYHGNLLPSWVTADRLSEIASVLIQASPATCNLDIGWYKKIIGSIGRDLVWKITQESLIISSNPLMNLTKTNKIYVYTTFGFTLATLFDVLAVQQRVVNPSSELVIELWKTGSGEIAAKVYYKDGINGHYEELKNYNSAAFGRLFYPYMNNLTHNQEECISHSTPVQQQVSAC